MKIKEYMQLLLEHKKEEAHKIRISTIPDKLIKFVWLNEDDSDEKKFQSLRNNEIWFSHRRYLNDPYEFKGMMIDRQKMQDAGFQEAAIDKYQTIFEFDDYGITCLSANFLQLLIGWQLEKLQIKRL